MQPKMKCDFCSAPDPGWKYPCRDFTEVDRAHLFIGNSVGDWSACAACHALVEADDRAGLSTRSALSLIAAQPRLEGHFTGIQEAMVKLHAQFFASRLRLFLAGSAGVEMIVDPPVPIESGQESEGNKLLTVPVEEFKDLLAMAQAGMTLEDVVSILFNEIPS